MKLIIDIDEQHFEVLQSAVRNGMGDNSQKIIANGIPLGKIREEIQEELKQDNHSFYRAALKDVIKIIDRYEGEQE